MKVQLLVALLAAVLLVGVPLAAHAHDELQQNDAGLVEVSAVSAESIAEGLEAAEEERDRLEEAADERAAALDDAMLAELSSEREPPVAVLSPVAWTGVAVDASKYHVRTAAERAAFAIKSGKEANVAALKAQQNKYIKAGRQSTKFQRPMWNSVQQPHPSSAGAIARGDRDYNTLFPAATALSDGKAPSQLSDFQHAGRGDLYVGHTGMLQQAEQMSDVPAAPPAIAATLPKLPADAAAPEPCAVQCEGPGLWRTAPCQDCIVRGMTNGWIVKSVQEQQRGYNYVHFARNQCVKYANDMQLRGAASTTAPFAACLFQKIHESCNL